MNCAARRVGSPVLRLARLKNLRLQHAHRKHTSHVTPYGSFRLDMSTRLTIDGSEGMPTTPVAPMMVRAG